LQGNPTVLLLLFLPDDALVIRTSVGEQLQKLAPAFASRRAGKRFLGYLDAQRQRLVGERGQRDVNRVELVEQFGYDTKYAMHMLRLGHQGVEFLESGRLTLPMREPVRDHLMDVRRGRGNLADVLEECTQLELRLASLLDSSPLPLEPHVSTVEHFVMDTYEPAWASHPRLSQLMTNALPVKSDRVPTVDVGFMISRVGRSSPRLLCESTASG
jgi:uncharacterized protein